MRAMKIMVYFEVNTHESSRLSSIARGFAGNKDLGVFGIAMEGGAFRTAFSGRAREREGI
jgi:hypothetical protein